MARSDDCPNAEACQWCRCAEGHPEIFIDPLIPDGMVWPIPTLCPTNESEQS